jgi:hypothetical protein
MKSRNVPYSQARRQIHDADLLLFRPRTWYTKAIAVAGRSEYVHAAMAGWWNGRLMCVEMTSGGGRAQLLSNIVEQWPGSCDVYRSNGKRGHRFSRAKALAAMVEITGKPYGTVALWHAAWLHIPIWRFLVAPALDDADVSGLPLFCSEAVSVACKRGGVDPVPNLADQITEPGDLARSAFFAYKFTLTWKAQK